MTVISKEEFVYRTCLLLIQHYRNIVEAGGVGFNSRLFEHILHPEYAFVGAGHSVEAASQNATHPEHVVPCALMNTEVRRLITENRLSNEEIAKLLQKHWKIVKLTKSQAAHIDFNLAYKSTMPPGWDFETGDTFARLKEAGISIIPSSPGG